MGTPDSGRVQKFTMHLIVYTSEFTGQLEEIDEVFKKTPEEIMEQTAFATIECEGNN